MASTLLASTAITLSSLIAMLMSSKTTASTTLFIYGDRSASGYSVKFFSILVCFLVAFLLNVQSIRYYSHASILINVPYKKIYYYEHHNSNSNSNTTCIITPTPTPTPMPAEFVGRSVNRGSYFWSLGLRAFYFSLPLFLWLFGPIPMFVSCCLLVFLLYFLDFTFEFAPDSSQDHQTGRHTDDVETP